MPCWEAFLFDARIHMNQTQETVSTAHSFKRIYYPGCASTVDMTKIWGEPSTKLLQMIAA